MALPALVPSNKLINTLWRKLLSHVKGSWVALDSGDRHPDEERPPLDTLFDVRAELPPPECVEHDPAFTVAFSGISDSAAGCLCSCY